MLHAIVMAGGSGTRFWPASRAALPKQLLPLAGERTLLEDTVARLEGLVPPERMLVVTSAQLLAAAGAALVALADAAVRAGGPRLASHAARTGLVLALAAVALPPRAATWLEGVATALAIAIAALAVALAPRRGPASGPRDRDAAAAPGRNRRPRRPAERVPGHLRQRFTRYDTPAGTDCLRGRINVEIAAGARTAHGHVGFCPAFEVTPAVEVTTDYDGVEATVAAAEVLPWGVRVEVRLAEPAEEPLEIPVDLRVRSPD
jgi:hypothetical protein